MLSSHLSEEALADLVVVAEEGRKIGAGEPAILEAVDGGITSSRHRRIERREFADSAPVAQIEIGVDGCGPGALLNANTQRGLGIARDARAEGALFAGLAHGAGEGSSSGSSGFGAGLTDGAGASDDFGVSAGVASASGSLFETESNERLGTLIGAGFAITCPRRPVTVMPAFVTASIVMSLLFSFIP